MSLLSTTIKYLELYKAKLYESKNVNFGYTDAMTHFTGTFF